MKKKNSKTGFIVLFLLGILVALTGIALIVGDKTKGNKNADSKNNTDKKEDISVVASFYPMYVIAENLLDGIDGVTLSMLSEPKTGCLHDFVLTPDDMKKMEQADIFVINGSGAESFIDKIIKENADLSIIDATKGMRGDEEELMHAWMDIENYGNEIINISKGLEEALPKYATMIATNSNNYLSKIAELKSTLTVIKDYYGKDRNCVLLSEAFTPFAKSLGLNVLGIVDLDEEREVSAGEVKTVVGLIENNEKTILIVDERYGKKMAETILNEVDVNVVYINPLTVGEFGDKDYYLNLMDENLTLIKECLKK